MEQGSNQAILAKVNAKTEFLEYDYSQELLPEEEQKTGPDIWYKVDIQILHSYRDKTFEELYVPPWMFGVLTLGEAYLFFFDKVSERHVPVATSFLPREGAYDWVESLASSDKLSSEQALACKALAAREREAEKSYHDRVAKGGSPF